MKHVGIILGIVGGAGLGLLLGSEFSGRWISIIGAILMCITLIAMILYRLKEGLCNLKR